MNKFLSCSKFIVLALAFVFLQRSASATPYLVMNVNPWGQTTDQTCMNAVFGAGNWIQANFSTPAATIFQASTQFVMLEGSDGNSGLPGFVTTNITTIENWVNAGGRLFINAGPNYSGNQNWGFTNTQLVYPYFSNTVSTAVPGNQIFLGPWLPTATTYSGSSFGHARITGTGLTTLLYDAANPANPVLCYKQWGNGIVFFGGCTLPFAWSPNPQGYNLWQNIFSYVNTFPLIGITTTVTGSPWCAGANITVNYAALNLTFIAGNQFKVQLSDAAGSFASPTQIGIITSQSTSGSITCTIPAAQATGTGYRIRTVSTTPVFTGANNGTNLTINASLTPAVTITANPSGPICAGTNVTFTATVTNGGPTPIYAWKLNGNPVGGNTPTYSNAALTNGNQVTCVVTSNATCANPTTVTSNIITMVVNPNVTPTITITANPGNLLCLGQSVTFTSAITNGGPSPTYIWKVNGSPVGTAATYTTNILVGGDIVTCELTSNVACASVNVVLSNAITITTNPTIIPTINITANPGNQACAGANVTFTANITNGGPTPAYQWYVNGNPVGTGPTYSTTTLVNGNIVSCTLTSNATCANPTSASASIPMTINPNVTPTISIAASPGTTICAGTSVTFTATITNGGVGPTYQWYVNGNPAGNNGPAFTTTGLANGDVVTCKMTSSATCPVPAFVTSNALTMTVNPVLIPTVSVSANPGNMICNGTNVTFSAAITNGGANPTYLWKVNGNPVPGNNPTYSSAALVNGDMITCTLTSTATCATPVTVTSSTLTMIVYTNVTPGVSISNNTGNTICSGTNVTFTAAPSNGGPTPTYQWYRNANPVGNNSATFMDNTLANNDVISCTITSNAACASPLLASSNTVAMTVIPSVNPTATVSANPGNSICAGTNVTFNAAVTNGGPTPVYQWKKNGNPVGGNSPTYANNALNNSDVISCTITSNATCATPATVNSNNITMGVTSTVIPTANISAAPGNTICLGTPVTFTAATANGGSTPIYQWYVNGIPAGSNVPTFTSAALVANDVITCGLTSNAACATPPVVTSNGITMSVMGVTVPSVTITASTGDTICEGTGITFTANAVNGGPAPVYNWMKNGYPVGTSTDTYVDNYLYSNDVISCVLVSSDLCPSPLTDTSNSKMITVNQYISPAVFLSGTPHICTGNPVSLSALAYNAGPSPSYQWMLNGVPNGTGPTWTGNMMNDGDVVYCVLSTTEPCVTQNAVNSDIDIIRWFNAGYLAGTVGGTEANTVNITSDPSIIGDNDCDLITTVIPNGPVPVGGNIDAGVTLDATINFYNTQPYLQRHYDIQPSTNPGSATAVVKIYAYQYEFDAYDSLLVSNSLTLPPLPANHMDNGNVRVTQFHGTGTAPGNYTGTQELIFPSVIYDTANNWWELTFPVKGFGGFYIHTSSVVFPLGVSNVNSGIFSMKAYPNPAHDKVEVRLHGKRTGDSYLMLTDLLGRTIINVPMDNDKAVVDMSSLSSGMYMLRYKDDTRTETVKITKQ